MRARTCVEAQAIAVHSRCDMGVRYYNYVLHGDGPLHRKNVII